MAFISWGQTAALPPQKGQIQVQEALIYAKPDFDSAIIAQLKGGEVFDISRNLFGAFYRIRIKDKRIGYVPDIDIKVLTTKAAAEQIKTKNRIAPPKNIKEQRFRGLSVMSIAFREDTLEQKSTEALTFYGAEFIGPDLLEKGDYPLDIHFRISPKPPGYYQTMTGYGANGFVVVADVLLNISWQSRSAVIANFGFGPLLKYSKFDVALQNASGQRSSYSLEDIMLGVSLKAGLTLRIQPAAVHFEAQYFWEKQQYMGYGVSFLWNF